MNRGLIGLMSIAVALALAVTVAAAVTATPGSPSGSAPTAVIAAGEARSHIGETATVCGAVAATRYAPQLRGEPTFLQLGHAGPDADFTVVVLRSNRAALPMPDSPLGHHICVSGRIRLFRGKPQVTLAAAAQLQQ